MEGIILGIILGLVTYFTLLGPLGAVWAIILAIVVLLLEAGAVGYIVRRR